MIAKWTRVTVIASVALIVVLSAIVPTTAQAPVVRNIAQPPTNRTIAVRTARAGGVKLQYLTAGRGPAVVLLHGYAETSRMWRPLMPRLAEHFTVIAPDLPGIGGSDIPSDGLDMTHAAVRIHDLVKGLGIQRAVVVGHDIGLMVAYAYAAQFPAETDKLVLMDAFLPGVDGWEAIYNNPTIWHFRFNGPTPEALVRTPARCRTPSCGRSGPASPRRRRRQNCWDRRPATCRYGRSIRAMNDVAEAEHPHRGAGSRHRVAP